MQTLTEMSRWIRDYGRDPRHMQRLLTDRFSWHQLWTAMDTLDDADSAMDTYLESEFPSDTGERYLRVYGVMQALFLQQDALNDLIKVIHPAKSINVGDVLKDVREARNMSVGRPTNLKRNGKVFAHAISRSTISKDGFDLISFAEEDSKTFPHVPVRDLIEKQRAEAVRILSEVIRDLKETDEAHKIAFHEKKLRKAFDQVLYAFEKISEDIDGSTPVIMGRWGVDHLQSSLDAFAALLRERGLAVDTYDSIQYQFDEIEHPLSELRKFFAGEPSEISSPQTARVFANALKPSFQELMDIAEEIDNEYTLAATLHTP